MMLAYQPIRSLATINMIVFSGRWCQRIYKVIDEPIRVNNNPKLADLNVSKGDIQFSNVSLRREFK